MRHNTPAMHNPSRPSPRNIFSLAILALILHGLMPLWMLLPALSGTPMELCAGSSVKTVFLHTEVPGQAPPAHDDDTPHCPLCLSGSHATLSLALAPALPLLTGLLHVQARPRALQPHTSLFWPHYQPRAPPVLSA